MLVKEFDYRLPAELIARYPVPERDASRLLLLNRNSKQIAEDHFRNISAHLVPGDVLVMNDTRVMPARLFGSRDSGGKVEIFLVRRTEDSAERWSCLLRASKKFRDGQMVHLAGGMKAMICARAGEDSWLVEFAGPERFEEWLEREGHIPLPPYLQREDDADDRERYQTVFSRTTGAVAAPTAGLHFTRDLLAELATKGVRIAYLTLHTGLGTFQPVRVERIEDHRIHVERYSIPDATAEEIRSAKERGSRVIAVGTTTTRTLEYVADSDGNVASGSGEADIYIIPGYRFKVIDALITNFHLPESTLLMLVSAFAGHEYTLAAYREAVSRGFRFYSYGDAMLIE
jgi:S-adenosylmethionine:tRNA ribosyltransferase-isomerase